MHSRQNINKQSEEVLPKLYSENIAVNVELLTGSPKENEKLLQKQQLINDLITQINYKPAPNSVEAYLRQQLVREINTWLERDISSKALTDHTYMQELEQKKKNHQNDLEYYCTIMKRLQQKYPAHQTVENQLQDILKRAVKGCYETKNDEEKQKYNKIIEDTMAALQPEAIKKRQEIISKREFSAHLERNAKIDKEQDRELARVKLDNIKTHNPNQYAQIKKEIADKFNKLTEDLAAWKSHRGVAKKRNPKDNTSLLDEKIKKIEAEKLAFEDEPNSYLLLPAIKLSQGITQLAQMMNQLSQLDKNSDEYEALQFEITLSPFYDSYKQQASTQALAIKNQQIVQLAELYYKYQNLDNMVKRGEASKHNIEFKELQTVIRNSPVYKNNESKTQAIHMALQKLGYEKQQTAGASAQAKSNIALQSPNSTQINAAQQVTLKQQFQDATQAVIKDAISDIPDLSVELSSKSNC